MVFLRLNEPAASHRGDAGRTKFRPLAIVLFVTGMVIMILMYIVPTQLPFLLRERGISQFTLGGTFAGIALSVHALGVVVTSLSYARMKTHYSFPHMFAFGFLLMAVAYFVTAGTLSSVVLLCSVFAAGAGFGWLIANTNYWLVELAPPEVRGRMIGVVTTFLFLGQFVSPIVAEPIVSTGNISLVFKLAGVVLLVLTATFLVFARAMVRADGGGTTAAD